MNVKTLMEYHDNRYNGFYSVTVQDENGQVYSPTALENLPADGLCGEKINADKNGKYKPRVEGADERCKLGMSKGRWYRFRGLLG